MELYLVTTGPPGPGAFQLLVDAGITEPDDDRTRKALAGACEFVELEDEEGRGRGGVEWAPHPHTEGLWRLGPFRSAA